MFGKKGLKSAAIQTLIGQSAVIEGNLRFEGGCHIDGLVRGNVGGSGDGIAYLSVSENGRVLGNVEVPQLALSGAVEGNVIVRERAELGPTARVTGDVYYNLIEIAAGAEINGKLIHQPGAATARAPGRSAQSAEAAPVAELEAAH